MTMWIRWMRRAAAIGFIGAAFAACSAADDAATSSELADEASLGVGSDATCGQLGGVLCGAEPEDCEGIAGLMRATRDCAVCCGVAPIQPLCKAMGGTCRTGCSYPLSAWKASDCDSCCIKTW